MGLRLGSGKPLKVNASHGICRFNLYTKTPITNGIRLLSSEGYILKDNKGVYLTVKEAE